MSFIQIIHTILNVIRGERKKTDGQENGRNLQYLNKNDKDRYPNEEGGKKEERERKKEKKTDETKVFSMIRIQEGF